MTPSYYSQNKGSLTRRLALPALGATAVVASLLLAACTSSAGGSGANGGAQFGSTGIHLVVSASPGGGGDIATRQIEPYLAEQLHTKITISYQASAGGALAFQQLKGESCDYVTMGTEPKVILSQLLEKAAYNYATDIASIGGFTRDIDVIEAKAGTKWDSLQTLINYAKANPNKLDVGSGLTGV